jgi:hypothetical protein
VLQDIEAGMSVEKLWNILWKSGGKAVEIG